MPFHEKIYALSGYGKMWERYGEEFSYDLCPRAKIFRRDQAGVKDLESLKHIMRSNGVWLFQTLTLTLVWFSIHSFVVMKKLYVYWFGEGKVQGGKPLCVSGSVKRDSFKVVVQSSSKISRYLPAASLAA